jgi:hypothetical protein
MKHSEPFSLLGEDLRCFTLAKFPNSEILQKKEESPQEQGSVTSQINLGFLGKGGAKGRGRREPPGFTKI